MKHMEIIRELKEACFKLVSPDRDHTQCLLDCMEPTEIKIAPQIKTWEQRLERAEEIASEYLEAIAEIGGR